MKAGPQSAAERARMRYGDTLYRTALLRDPHPARAAAAVVKAWQALDWGATPLDDRLEARLVAALPRLRTNRLGWGRKPPLPPLPAQWWRLPATTRVALYLRLVRGMPTPMIAMAVGRTLAGTQTLLLHGVALSHGEALGELPVACHQCRRARLDDLQAERGHLLTCDACRAALPVWEQHERDLAQRLVWAVGSLTLPASADAALAAAWNADRATPTTRWRTPWVLRLGAVGAVVLVLGMLVWPRAVPPPTGTASGPRTAQGVIAQAQAAYGAVPAGDEVIHRRWQLALTQPSLPLQADEWVDVTDPARHRMQLLDGKGEAREWQVGDGTAKLHYQSNLATTFCGNVSAQVFNSFRAREHNVWRVGPDEQRAMRQARWQTGAWALGRHYLDTAAQADTVRALGVAGTGAEAALLVAAEGRKISGTLVLRLDPRTYELREVREVRQNNGQTAVRTPWKLMLTERIPEVTALQQSLLTNYPLRDIPAPTERKLARDIPILDRACPLTGAEVSASFPRVLASSYNLVGLPNLPPGIERAVTTGLLDANNQNQTEGFYLNGTVQLLYLGPGKRLVFSPSDGSFSVPQRAGASASSGQWTVQFAQSTPGIVAAFVVPRGLSAVGPQYSWNNTFHVWAEGWSRDELLVLLATARPLTLADWARAPKQWYEPEPMDATLAERLQRTSLAAAVEPGKTLHEIRINTQRQAPFYAALADPYHLAVDRNPPTTRDEQWAQVDSAGMEVQYRFMSSGPTGKPISVAWRDGTTGYQYRGQDNVVITNTITPQSVSVDWEIQVLFRLGNWQWQRLPDGALIAERIDPTTLRSSATEKMGLDSWMGDLPAYHLVTRLHFAADGSLHKKETLAVPSGEPATPIPPFADPSGMVIVNSTVIERREWVDGGPPDGWDFSPPPNTHLIPQCDYYGCNGPLGTQVVSLTLATDMVPFPIYSWPLNGNVAFAVKKLEVVRVQSTQSTQSDNPFVREIEQAVGAGLAVHMEYQTIEGTLNVIQGPAEPLREILQRTSPPWTLSERRVVAGRGQALNVWVMRGTDPMKQWVATEIDDTLFYLRHTGSATELDRIIRELYALVPAQRAAFARPDADSLRQVWRVERARRMSGQ